MYRPGWSGEFQSRCFKGVIPTAEKRMFTQKIIDSDAFLEMPTSAQALYFHLNMRADDDGFVNNPKKITRYVGAAEDDLKLLLLKRFIIGFDSGVIVIKHWRMHNTLKMDRYKPTDYQEEFATLRLKENKSYTDKPLLLDDGTEPEPEWKQDGTSLEPQIRIDKNRLDKNREEEADKPPRSQAFKPPTVEEVAAYCQERQNGIDPQAFVDFYEGTKWFRGKTKIKDWKACVRTWEQRDRETPPREKPQPQKKPKQYTTAEEYNGRNQKPINSAALDEIKRSFGLT